jgi:hypothetical protein
MSQRSEVRLEVKGKVICQRGRTVAANQADDRSTSTFTFDPHL